jgi:hypothetical protein
MPTDRTTAVLISALSIVLVTGFVALSVIGVDTTAYVVFLSGPLMTSVVGAVLSHKVMGIQTTMRAVEHQTNGIATAQRASLEAHLDAQDATAKESAREATELGRRLTQRPPGSPQSAQPDAA